MTANTTTGLPDARALVAQFGRQVGHCYEFSTGLEISGKAALDLFHAINTVLATQPAPDAAVAAGEDGLWNDMDSAPRDGSIVEVRSAHAGNPAVFRAAYVRPTGLVAKLWVPVRGQSVGIMPWKDGEVDGWRLPAAAAPKVASDPALPNSWVNTLEAEREQAMLLAEVELHLQQCRVFITSREKMHPCGVDLHDELQVKVTAALNAIGREKSRG